MSIAPDRASAPIIWSCTPSAAMSDAELLAQLYAVPITNGHHGRGAVWGLVGVFSMFLWLALFAGFYVMGGK